MLDFDAINADKILTRYDIKMESSEKPETIAARILPKDPALKKVAEDVMNLKGKLIEDDVKAALKSNAPEIVIQDGLLKGMDVVSELYGRGIYYLPHVMVAADAFDKGMKLAEGAMSTEKKTKGTAVMHAAEGDPHDIGKNIAAVLLKSNGYKVIDLGRDVLVDTVVDSVLKNKPNCDRDRPDDHHHVRVPQDHREVGRERCPPSVHRRRRCCEQRVRRVLRHGRLRCSCQGWSAPRRKDR